MGRGKKQLDWSCACEGNGRCLGAAFWSPRSRSLAYAAVRKLKVTAKGPGIEESVTVASVQAPAGRVCRGGTVRIGAQEQAAGALTIQENLVGALRARDAAGNRAALKLAPPAGVRLAREPTAAVTAGDLELGAPGIRLEEDDRTLLRCYYHARRERKVRLQVKDLHFSYGSVPALEGVTFKVNAGEMLGIVGPNGSGKSTLLRCLARILKPRTGTVYLDGRNLRTLRGLEVGRCLGYVPPPGARAAFSATVLETVLQGRRPYLIWGVERRDLEVVTQALGYLGLTELAERLLGELSSGQQQKVFIARALAQEPEVLLLDEPTATLDIRYQLEVMALIRRLATEKGRVVVAVLHDLNLAGRFADRLLLLHQGKIFAAGTAKVVLTPENLRAVYGVEAVVTEGPWGVQVTAVAPAAGLRAVEGAAVCAAGRG